MAKGLTIACIFLTIIATLYITNGKNKISVDEFGRRSALYEPPSSRCYQSYHRFYDKEEIRFEILFGYKDARPARFVGDRYERLTLIGQLLSPCPIGEHACGFVRSSYDKDLLEKEILGVDRNPRRIKAYLVNSSIGPDDNSNRKDPFQEWQSRYAKKHFVEGLQTADAVFYDGHSRDGGGPDFSPPKLVAGHTDYPWYVENTPGLNLLTQALLNTAGHTKLLGLFSCVSSQLFSEKVRMSAPDLGLISSPKLIYYADALRVLRSALNALLGMWCENDFTLALQSNSKIQQAELHGFFQKDPRQD